MAQTTSVLPVVGAEDRANAYKWNRGYKWEFEVNSILVGGVQRSMNVIVPQKKKILSKGFYLRNRFLCG